MISDSIQVKGDLTVKLFDQTGVIKDTRAIPNVVVTDGKGYIASRMNSNTAVIMSHMAVGSSSTAAAAGQSALGTELGRVVFDSASVSSTTVTYTATFPAGTGTGTLTEAGIFNASTGGTMLCRTTFSSVSKAAGDTVVITWNVTVS